MRIIAGIGKMLVRHIAYQYLAYYMTTLEKKPIVRAFLCLSALPDGGRTCFFDEARRPQMTKECNVLDEQNGVFLQHTAPLDTSVTFKFTGQTSEYFRIWIVNICLTIVTLGIYSAWAKVRNKRYFYGNTLLNNAAFDYLADPKAILKGRLIAVGILGAVIALRTFTRVDIFGLLYILLIPFIVIRSAMFNAANSAYRNVRFKFGVAFPPQSQKLGLERYTLRGYNKTSEFLILPTILLPLSLGLLYPYYVFRKRQFFMQNSAFGQTAFWFDGNKGDFYRAYLKVLGVLVGCLIGSVLTFGVGALPFFALFRAYHDAKIGQLSWRHTGLGGMRFECNWQIKTLFRLYFFNSLGIALSLGLLIPWAKIRISRYQIEGLCLYPAASFDGFVAAEVDQIGALGDEAGDLVDWDFGL